MARILDQDNTQYLAAGTSIGISAYPFTLACWFRPTTAGVASGQHHIMGFYDANGNRAWAFQNNGNNITILVWNEGFDSTAGATNLSANVWYHGAMTITSATVRELFLNGVSEAVDNDSSSTFGSADILTLGFQDNLQQSGAFDGDLAFSGVWDVVLPDEDIASLGSGVHPKLIQPENLIHAWDLWGHSGTGNEPASWGSTTLTVTGGNGGNTDSPGGIVFPSRMLVGSSSAAAGGGSALLSRMMTEGLTVQGSYA